MTARTSVTAESLLAGIEGQRIVVTAGGSGIGLVIAATLADLGARASSSVTSPTPRCAPPANRSASRVPSPADVSREADVDRLFRTVEDRLGGLDALINNAGIAGPTAKVQDIAPEGLAPLHRCLPDRTVPLRAPRRADADRGRRRLARLDVVGGRPPRLRAPHPYSAAKFGVIGLTMSLAEELGPHGIRVNAILPGIVEGPRIEGVIADRAERLGLGTEGDARALSREHLAPPHDQAVRHRRHRGVHCRRRPEPTSPASRSASTAISKRCER